MLAWWGDIGSNAKTSDSSVIGDVCGFSILPGSDDVYNSKTGAWKSWRAARTTRRTWPISAGACTSWLASTATRSSRGGLSAAAHLGGKDLSPWCAAYPSGFQPYRNSHFNIPEWVAAGYDEAFITSYLKSEGDPATTRMPRSSRGSPASSSTTAWPRTSWRRSCGVSRPQAGADNIAAAWEKITDQIGRRQADRPHKGLARPVG
jgi:multiple sugar transport system substrate-binding protein